MTLFQSKVYDIVKKIPKGKVLTYKQVAEKIGNAVSYRAVGNALNKNKSSQVPCHRVVRSDGKIGGYNKGTDLKLKLLKEEGFL
ncbi:MAG: MGMT family protein [Patescibacteria group bacterium]